MTQVNRQITLAARPVGFPRVSDFHLAYSALPSPGAGEVLLRSVYLSLDPFVRGRMSHADSRSRPLNIGEVMSGAVVAFVVASEDPDFEAGDVVQGMLGWQEYAIAPGSALRKVDPSLAPISTALGVLGVPGLTAYFGLIDVCEPRHGETVVVSAAAGAVGMLVGQIGRILGCRVVGITANDAQVPWLVDDLGFDAALPYTSSGDFETALGELCLDGVDVYFDNVGGATTDAVVRQITEGARISLCGQSSQCNLESPESGPRWLSRLIDKQAKVQGFAVSSYAARYPEGLAQLTGWLKRGALKYREDVAQGIEAAPQAFIAMLQERNHGKQLVQLSGL
jgi:NADPH-dependent curcumin reductase CurA